MRIINVFSWYGCIYLKKYFETVGKCHKNNKEMRNDTRRNAEIEQQREIQKKERSCFSFLFLFSTSWGDLRTAWRKELLFARTNIWPISPSVFPVCGRPISSERSGLWQGGLVMAAHSCNMDGAFHISAVNKGNRSRSFSISTAHDLPTPWQRQKGKQRGSHWPRFQTAAS